MNMIRLSIETTFVSITYIIKMCVVLIVMSLMEISFVLFIA